MGAGWMEAAPWVRGERSEPRDGAVQFGASWLDLSSWLNYSCVSVLFCNERVCCTAGKTPIGPQENNRRGCLCPSVAGRLPTGCPRAGGGQEGTGTKLVSRSRSGSGLCWAGVSQTPNLRARKHHVLGENPLETLKPWGRSSATALLCVNWGL